MHEKRHFLSYRKCRHDDENHVTICLLRHSGESLQNGQLEAPKTKLILCPRDPQGYSRISLSLSGRILKEYRNIVSASKQTPCGIFHGVCEIRLTEVLATQMGVMRRSKKVSSFELYKLSTFASLQVDCKGPHALLYLGSSAIVTVCSNTVGWHS